MTSSKEFQGRKTPSILLVGDGGTEKTRFLAQAPDVWIYDFDAGLSSTQDLPEFQFQTFKDAPVKSKAIDPERGIYPWGTSWVKFFDHLNDVMWPQIEAGTCPYRFLGVDSLTTLTSQCMNYVMKSGQKLGVDAPTLPEYGSQLRLMETTMEQLSAWPIGLIVTAHIKRDDNLVMGTKEYLPMITGQLSARLGVYFDEVYYTEVQGRGPNRKIVIKTEGEGMYKQAKSRNRVPTDSPLTWQAIGRYLGVG